MSEALLEQLGALVPPPRGDVLPAAPVSLSADLRQSGYKLAPVDVNLFPGGWHNLCPGMWPQAGASIAAWAAARGIGGRSVLVLAEWMTRNPAYLQNLEAIRAVLQAGGYDVRFGSVDEGVPELGAEFETPAGGTLLLERIRPDGHGGIRLAMGGAVDWVFGNSDFTAGAPVWLDQLKLPIHTPAALGWHRRRKGAFFAEYERLAREAAAELGLDPWALIPETTMVGPVDFWNEQGLDAVADAVDEMLARIGEAYRRRGIDDRPFVVVKDEAGTFGMGVTSLDSSEALRNPNRKLRQRMQRGKGGRPITAVVVQEGVYTRDLIGPCVAEPVMMAAGGRSIGGFFRYHCERDMTENLNARGMVFARLCSGAKSRNCAPDCVADPLRERVYGWMIELVAAAAGAEIERALGTVPA